MTAKIIKKAIKIVLGIFTYMVAIYFFVSEVNRFLDFCPLTVREAFDNMKTISVLTCIKVFFKDIIGMFYPIGVIASLTEFVPLMKILLGGFKKELEQEFFHPRDVIRLKDGVKVGDTAISGSLLAIFGRAVVIWIGISLMFLIKPIIIVKDIIRLIIMIVYVPFVTREGVSA
ncbi:MAG: hypothetical protein K6E32_03605 [Lachnospiraceae bacterium]|nr:hypothetical protein [Lachnospiraceae bacterium]